MLLNLTDSSALVAQPFGWIVPAQLLDQVTGVPRDIPGEFNGVDSLQDYVVSPHRVRARERRRACQQFEHQHAQGPVIGTNIMATVQNNLRSNVF